MGRFKTQKLTRAVNFKDADPYKEQLLFHDFAKFLVLMAAPWPQGRKRAKSSIFLGILKIFSKV
jgi:hypothetical protein